MICICSRLGVDGAVQAFQGTKVLEFVLTSAQHWVCSMKTNHQYITALFLPHPAIFPLGCEEFHVQGCYWNSECKSSAGRQCLTSCCPEMTNLPFYSLAPFSHSFEIAVRKATTTSSAGVPDCIVLFSSIALFATRYPPKSIPVSRSSTS